MDYAAAFSSDYASARERFRNVVKDIGGQLHSYAHSSPGPNDLQLTTDVAWIGPTNARRVLVTASGTHGVEGFCGSGAQIGWLQHFNQLSKDEKLLLLQERDTAVMLVHAVNPFGFAWLRRVTHENVDLNRNWANFATAKERNKEYDEIAEVLCPATWTRAAQDETLKQLQSYAQQHTLKQLIQVISEGQYRHEGGLFYGGACATHARQTLEQLLREHLSPAEHVAIVDFHSGLGAYGVGEIIAASFAGQPDFARSQAWYGASVRPIGAQGVEFAKIAGDWLTATPGILPKRQVTAVALEFGTVPPLVVLDALRADNWLHTRDNPNGPEAASIGKQMKDATA